MDQVAAHLQGHNVIKGKQPETFNQLLEWAAALVWCNDCSATHQLGSCLGGDCHGVDWQNSGQKDSVMTVLSAWRRADGAAPRVSKAATQRKLYWRQGRACDTRPDPIVTLLIVS